MGDSITEEYWSRFPDTYDKKMEYVVGKELRDEIIQELNRLSELGELVEFGCGTGIFTEVIVQKTKSMFATDLSDSLLAVARTRIGDHPKVTRQKPCTSLAKKTIMHNKSLNRTDVGFHFATAHIRRLAQYVFLLSF
ncbi:type 11 methyltransferase [Candidatus Magnetomorum sp. HK-1]|nr:type 11 methyltransferase [Candidatus Magnetomorum sp. HK-1]